jgi:hypothetical protein
MTRFAEQTKVARERTADEIERTLRRYGATGFAYAWADEKVMIGFEMHGRRIRFMLPIPESKDTKFTHSPTGRRRTAASAKQAFEQEVRRLWRALALIIKAKLEAVASEVTEFETEFLPYMLLPNNQTVGEAMVPQLDNIYASGGVPQLLPTLDHD